LHFLLRASLNPSFLVIVSQISCVCSQTSCLHSHHCVSLTHSFLDYKITMLLCFHINVNIWIWIYSSQSVFLIKALSNIVNLLFKLPHWTVASIIYRCAYLYVNKVNITLIYHYWYIRRCEPTISRHNFPFTHILLNFYKQNWWI